ncbi:MAG: acyl-CoA dehydrogenase family protein, partial [Thermoanaerobaculia bacterium]
MRAVSFSIPVKEKHMDFRLSDEQQQIRQMVREFAESEIRPHVMEWDEAQKFPM